MTLAVNVHSTDLQRKTPDDSPQHTDAREDVRQGIESCRIVRAKVRSLLHGHLNWLEREAHLDPDRGGLGVTHALLFACHQAIRRSVPDIEGSAPRLLQALSKDWPGPLPSDTTCRALRAALNRLATFSPFIRRTKAGWRICLGLGRATDIEDPRLALLTEAEIIPHSARSTGFRPAPEQGILLHSGSGAPDSDAEPYKERARPSSELGQGLNGSRKSWLAAAEKTGRVWGLPTAEMISSMGSVLGATTNEVAVALLGARRGTERRKWAKRPYTSRERIGVTRALERLLKAGLILREGNRWSVPEHATLKADRAAFWEGMQATLEVQRPKAIGEAPAISVLREVAKSKGLRVGSHESVRDLDRLLKAVDAKRGTDLAKGEGRWRYLLDEHAAKARFVAPYLLKVVEQIEIDWERAGFTVEPPPVLPPAPVQRVKPPAVTPPADHHGVPTFVRTTPLRPWEAAAEARAIARGWKQKDRFAS